MSYSRWGSRGSGAWYTYWCSQDDKTENRDTAIFTIECVRDYTAKELRYDMRACALNAAASEKLPVSAADELMIYMREFLADVDKSYPAEVQS